MRIPREFELPGEDAIVRKQADRLIIEPVPARSLLAQRASLIYPTRSPSCCRARDNDPVFDTYFIPTLSIGYYSW